jgi:hypothetical protein
MRSSLLPIAIASMLGCGAPPPPVSAPAAAASTSASVAPKRTDEERLCGRVCAAQARCGAPKDLCVGRCLPIARVLQTEVVEAMVACVEQKSPPTCDQTEAGQKARARLVGQCMGEATETKRDEAGSNVDLFAKAHCDRTKECGVDGPFSPAECMGRARDAIRKTEESGTGSLALYGALRPSSVDAVVGCLRGAACDKRSPDGAEQLGVCLDAVLASAAEPPK